MKRNLYIITLEPIEKRYTKQWYTFLKDEFNKYFKVYYVDGTIITDKIEKGRFLDINKTNKWKAEQVIELSKLFIENKVKDSDIFLFTDGWHPGIINLKYMIDLNNSKAKIYSYWHAGTWDDFDFVTEAGFRKWAQGFEQSTFDACSGHFVATQFHKDLIVKYFNKYANKIFVVGFPMDWITYMSKELNYDITLNNNISTKENIVVFPHRLDKEKQPQVFDIISKQMRDYKFIKTISVTKTKKEYYEILNKAKIVFSANIQETFGIGTVEAMMLNVIPMVPNRLSYVELYDDLFKYTSIPTVKAKIRYIMTNYGKDNHMMRTLETNKQRLIRQSLDSVPKMAKVMNK